MTRRYAPGFATILILFLAACATPPVPLVKHPECRAEIRRLQKASDHGDSAGAEDGLKAEQVGSEIGRHMDAVRGCYDQSATAKSTDEKRRIMFGFLVLKNGTVGRVCVEESQLKDIEFEACLTRFVRGLRFPPPRGGKSVAVSFPFDFVTNSR